MIGILDLIGNFARGHFDFSMEISRKGHIFEVFGIKSTTTDRGRNNGKIARHFDDVIKTSLFSK